MISEMAERESSERGLRESNPVIPKARPNPADAKYRDPAGALYRAMKGRADEGLSWRECWMVLDDAGHEGVAVGPCVIWMRSKGVPVLATYRAGETVFVLEVGVSGMASGVAAGVVTEGGENSPGVPDV